MACLSTKEKAKLRKYNLSRVNDTKSGLLNIIGIMGFKQVEIQLVRASCCTHRIRTHVSVWRHDPETLSEFLFFFVTSSVHLCLFSAPVLQRQLIEKCWEVITGSVSCCLHCFPHLFLLGEFAIRPEKKAQPVTKKVKYVGMIAGGTGTCVKTHLWPLTPARCCWYFPSPAPLHFLLYFLTSLTALLFQG